MRLIDLGYALGKFSDVQADPRGWVVILQDEATGNLPLIQLAPDGVRRTNDVTLEAGGGNAFPRLWVDPVTRHTWLTWRHEQRGGLLFDITVGAMWELGPVHGNCPVAIGEGVCWYQENATYRLAYRLLAQPQVAEGSFLVGKPTGLACVNADGQPELIDDARLSVPGMVNPQTAGACTVGENRTGPDRNIARLTDTREAVIWPGLVSNTPRIATAGGPYAVVTWGGPGGRLALLADADFTDPVPEPPPVDRWALVPDGTPVSGAKRALFGEHPPTSHDGKRIYFAKNAPPQGEWREVDSTPDIFHLFDRSRGEDVPTGTRQGWYLTPRACCKWGQDSFTSGQSFSVAGEKVEYDNGARVPWQHTITMYGLVAGGVMFRTDPRFPGMYTDLTKVGTPGYTPVGYEHMYNRLDGAARWDFIVTPLTAKGVIPWGDPSMDVVLQHEENPPTTGAAAPPPAYVECPRLSVDVDPWATKPEPPPVSNYTPVAISDPEFSELAARLERKYQAPPDQGGLGRGPTETFVDQLGASRWRRDYFYNRDTGAQPDQAWRAVNNGINAVLGYPPGLDPNFPGQPPIQPADPLVALHVEGTSFRRPDGVIWKYRFASAFNAFQKFLAGDDLTQYAAWTRSVHCNGWRFFHTWQITGFDPRRYGWPQYHDALIQFRQWTASQGLHLHNTVFCDQGDGSPVQMSRADQDQLLEIVRVVMQGELVGGFNEAFKNGGNDLCASFAPSQFAGTLAERSSWEDGKDPRVCGSILSFTSEHPPRDNEWPRKAKNGYETSTGGGDGKWDETGVPAVLGEPIGIFERDVPGSRTGNPSDCADFYAVAELLTSGACIHGDGGTLQRCLLPGPQAQQCIEWAHAARICIPDIAQLGQDTRGGLAECPIEHSDSKALRTFAMIYEGGHKATVAVVRPTADWRAVGVNGWRVDSIEGPNGHIVKVSR